VPLVVAAGLATAAVAATLAEAPAAGVFAAVITVPFALYAALAAPRFAVPLALAAAVAGIGVVIYWIYTLISLLSKGGLRSREPAFGSVP
jgi:hypothetical protein